MTRISPRRSARRVVRSFGVLLLIGGCGPKIKEFTVEPRRVCAGDTVRVAFKTSGQPRLIAVRHGGPPVDTTTYTLIAESRGKVSHSAMDVVTFSARAVPVLAFDTELLGQDSLVARDSLRPETWQDGVRVGQLFADSGRVLLVRHAGKEGVVQSGPGGSAALSGAPVSGEWEIRSALLPGEVPGDPKHHPPAHLYLRVGVACGAGGQP